MVATKMLVVVDTQIDFSMPFGKLYVPGAERIIPTGYRVLSNLDPKEYCFLLRTMDTHTEKTYEGSSEQQGWPELGIPPYPLHCADGTPGWKNIFNFDVVHRDIKQFELKKTVFDAWKNPLGKIPLVKKVLTLHDNIAFDCGRDSLFSQLHRDYHIDTLTVFGLASDRCVKDFIAGALAFGFNVEVVEDACAGLECEVRQVIEEIFPGKVKIIQSTDFEPKKEEWVDEDDAPELTADWFAKATPNRPSET